MERLPAIAEIRKACDNIARELMTISPAVKELGDKETQDEIVKTLYQITTSLEVVKKRIGKLTRHDDSPLL